MNQRTRTPWALLGLIVLIGSLTGCGSLTWSSDSSSKSLDWSSNSSSRSLEWSSDRSSEDDEKETAYRNDVQEYTAAFAASEGDLHAFQRDISAIARGYGITDWERERGTYIAIGRGLARARLERDRYEELSTALTNRDAVRLSLVRAGYETLPPR